MMKYFLKSLELSHIIEQEEYDYSDTSMLWNEKNAVRF